MFRITEVVKHLLIVNVLVFLAVNVMHFGGQVRLPNGQFLSMLAMFYPGSEHFALYQVVTNMFAHGDFGHLLFNMLSLFFIGPMVEQGLRSKRFLLYYLLCGFGALGVHLLFMHPEGAVLGASGAIYGVFIAFAVMYPNVQLMLLFPPIPVKAKYLVPIIIGLDLVLGISGTATGIAHFAHIGGALTGFILLTIWGYVRFRR